MELSGARQAVPTPGQELPGKVNYIRGNDPRQWQLGLPTFERVTYSDVYPGIDLVYYGNQRQLEFDLVLKPGANPGQVRMKFAGAQKVLLGRDRRNSSQCSPAARPFAPRPRGREPAPMMSRTTEQNIRNCREDGRPTCWC